MSLLYKKLSDTKVSLDVSKVPSDKIGEPFIVFDFSSDCGKFGTDEQLATFKFTPEELLEMFFKTTNEL